MCWHNIGPNLAEIGKIAAHFCRRTEFEQNPTTGPSLTRSAGCNQGRLVLARCGPSSRILTNQCVTITQKLLRGVVRAIVEQCHRVRPKAKPGGTKPRKYNLSVTSARDAATAENETNCEDQDRCALVPWLRNRGHLPPNSQEHWRANETPDPSTWGQCCNANRRGTGSSRIQGSPARANHTSGPHGGLRSQSKLESRGRICSTTRPHSSISKLMIVPEHKCRHAGLLPCGGGLREARLHSDPLRTKSLALSLRLHL